MWPEAKTSSMPQRRVLSKQLSTSFEEIRSAWRRRMPTAGRPGEILKQVDVPPLLRIDDPNV